MTEILTPPPQADLEEYRRLARQVSRELLASHVARDERMRYLPFNEAHPESFDFPFQDPEAFVVPSPRMPVEEGNKWANMADRRFDDMIAMAGEGQEAQEIIHEAGEIVANGGFIWEVTAHIEDLTDIAYAGHIVTNHLASLGRPECAPEETMLMLSMALSEGAYTMELEDFDEPVDVPMVGVTQTGFTKVVRTWPRTGTAKDIVAKLPVSVVEWINANAVGVAKDTVAEGHATGAMGPTGSTKLVGGAMAPINTKTRDMLTLPNAYMLGMTVWRQSDTPVARYMGRPVKVDAEHPGQVDDFFVNLTSDMNAHIPGVNLRYQRPDDRVAEQS
ncbi:MAG: hypothetical protein ACREJM_01000 [Candidatus Saccharimonadales bacterium]